MRPAAKGGGAEPGHRPLARWADDQDPRARRRRRPAARLPADRRSGCGLPGGGSLCPSGCRRAPSCTPTRATTDRVRSLIEGRGSAPNISPRGHRRWKNCFSPFLYRRRNAIERMFGRLKDFRRIATRYDKLAANFLAAVHLAAIVSYWL